jgi:hypothetical protein
LLPKTSFNLELKGYFITKITSNLLRMSYRLARNLSVSPTQRLIAAPLISMLTSTAQLSTCNNPAKKIEIKKNNAKNKQCNKMLEKPASDSSLMFQSQLHSPAG